MFYTSATKNAAFYQQNVKSFIIDPLGDSDQRGMRTVIKRMTGLQSLICLRGCGALDALLDSCQISQRIVIGSGKGGPIAPGSGEDIDDTYPYKNLRELGLPSNIFFTHTITFNHRIFQDLTHLIFAFFSPDPAYESLWHLSNLTHLAFKTMGVIDLEDCVALLLGVFPPSLRVIIFGCVNGYNEDFDLMTFESEYILPSFPFEAWCDEHPLLSYYSNAELDELHLITRMTIGNVDPRIVVGSGFQLAPGHLFRDDVVPLPGTCYWEPEYWSIAEGIIERRRSYTEADIISNLSRHNRAC